MESWIHRLKSTLPILVILVASACNSCTTNGNTGKKVDLSGRWKMQNYEPRYLPREWASIVFSEDGIVKAQLLLKDSVIEQYTG